MTESTNTGSPSGDPGSPDGQRNQVLDLLRKSNEALTDEDVRDRLGIKYSAAGPRLIELYDHGLAEPLPKTQGKERQQWRAVPDDRREEVKAAALRRRRTALLRSVTRQKVWLQGWLVGKVLAINAPGQDEMIKRPCPSGVGTGDCDCPTANVWVLRHEKRKKTFSRVRREATRWRNERRELQAEIERAQKADPPAVQFLKDKQFAREALHIVSHLEARVDEEHQLRRDLGYGEVSDGHWEVMRVHVDEVDSALQSLKGALRLMLDDEGDFTDVEPLDEWEADEVAELVAGDIVDADIVD